VDEVEARSVLDRRVADLRRQSYVDLKAAWFKQPDCEQIQGLSGAEYQVEVEALWDDRDFGTTVTLRPFGFSRPSTTAGAGARSLR
jgi:hypothetical protein